MLYSTMVCGSCCFTHPLFQGSFVMCYYSLYCYCMYLVLYRAYNTSSPLQKGPRPQQLLSMIVTGYTVPDESNHAWGYVVVRGHKATNCSHILVFRLADIKKITKERSICGLPGPGIHPTRTCWMAS